MRNPVWNGSENTAGAEHPLVPDDDHLRADITRYGDERVSGVSGTHHSAEDFHPDALEPVRSPADDTLGVGARRFVETDGIDDEPAGDRKGSAVESGFVGHYYVQGRSKGGGEFTCFVDSPVGGARSVRANHDRFS
jgi:hypothetical protein